MGFNTYLRAFACPSEADIGAWSVKLCAPLAWEEYSAMILMLVVMLVKNGGFEELRVPGKL